MELFACLAALSTLLVVPLSQGMYTFYPLLMGHCSHLALFITNDTMKLKKKKKTKYGIGAGFLVKDTNWGLSQDRRCASYKHDIKCVMKTLIDNSWIQRERLFFLSHRKSKYRDSPVRLIHETGSLSHACNHASSVSQNRWLYLALLALVV
jgi:hypothetical protein